MLAPCPLEFPAVPSEARIDVDFVGFARAFCQQALVGTRACQEFHFPSQKQVGTGQGAVDFVYGRSRFSWCFPCNKQVVGVNYTRENARSWGAGQDEVAALASKRIET